MNPRTTCLSTADLARFLENDFADEQEVSLLAHLDHCEACRSRLDAATADADEWSEVAAFLNSLPEDFRQAPSGTKLECSGSGAFDPSLDVLNCLSPTDDPQMLGRLGAYEIVGVVGSGGMGVVLKGYDRALNRFVAIKVLAPALAMNAAARQRFAREARAAAAVVHEHVIAIHCVSEHRGLPYLVMPYLSGPSLERRIDRGGALEVVEVLRIARQVALGLAAAHEQGLVHRDVKPANILLEADLERVTITDFGLARLIDDVTVTQTGVIAGTPQYMSPEQSRAEALDSRSDLFSLGSVMYAMCTGSPPFPGGATVTVLRRICEEEPIPIRELNPQIPDWLCEIVEKLHCKDPGERFQSAEELAGRLEAWLVHLQQPLHVPAPRRLTRSRRGRALLKNKARMGVVGLLVLAISFASWLTYGELTPPSPPANNGTAGIELTYERVPVSIPPVVQNVRAVSFSGDGRILGVAHGNQKNSDNPGPGSLQIWDVGERRLLASLPQLRGVNSVAVSTDGRLAAFGTFEDAVKVIELPDAKEVHRIPAGNGAPVVFSRDGGFLAVAAHPRIVEIWDTSTWRRLAIDFEGKAFAGVLLSIALSPDGGMVAVGGGAFAPDPISGQAVMWDLGTGKELLSIDAAAAIMQVAFSPDGRHLAAACLDTNATLWDVTTGKRETAYRDPESGLVGVLFAGEGNTIATLGPRSGIKLFNQGSAKPHGTLKFDDHLIEAMASDGRTIASGGTDRIVRLWDVQSQFNTAVLGPESADAAPAPIRSLAVSDNEEWIALGRDDGGIVLRDCGGTFVRTLTGHEGSIGSLLFLEDSETLISGGRNGSLVAWNVATGDQTRRADDYGAAITSLAVSPDGSLLAVAANEEKIRILDPRSLKPRQEWRTYGGPVSVVAFSPDGARLLAAGSEGVVEVWDVKSRDQLLDCQVDQHAMTCAAFSPDGVFIITGSDDGGMILFNARTGLDRRALRGHDGAVRALAYSRDGATLVSGGDDGLVRVWDTKTLDQRQALAAHTDEVMSVSLLQKSNRLVTAGLDRSVKFWSPDDVRREQLRKFSQRGFRE
jgi:WD40 repeat protein